MKRYKVELCGITLHGIVILLIIIYSAHAIEFTKTSNTYAKFPKWNACINSSISFEFKTSAEEALLMYTDDNGRFDYVEILLVDRRVRLRMNIVDGREGSVEITVGKRLNDNKWHRVEIQRNRMETTLFVDGKSDSRVAFGSDFNFGNLTRNNYVYFGGLPTKYYNGDQKKLETLSLPSVFFEPRFEGSMRNIIYGNCTCIPVRGKLIDSDSVTLTPREACDVNNNCGNCLCISRDDGPGCQCVGFDCPQDLTTFYHLPMDAVRDDTLVNPSGLDAKVTGDPELVSGVISKAITIDGRTQKIKVSGPGHRNECFGNLKLCKNGYTLSFWLRFESAGQSEEVYLSNGAQNTNSHGVAMLYQIGRLVWIFRMIDGEEWRVAAYDILPRHWYHVAVTWKQNSGLMLFINGEKIARVDKPVNRATSALPSSSNDFVIGRANDDEGSGDVGIMTIDDFQFWSRRMSENEIRETGAVYHYHLPMDSIVDGQMIVPNLEPKLVGKLRLVPGKIGKAVALPGRGEHIDLGSFSDTCIGNVSICKFGFTVSFWIYFTRLRDNSYVMASGVTGFSIFTYGSRLYGNVNKDDRQWQTSVSGINKNQWYFVEISWNQDSGLKIYINQERRATQPQSTYEQTRSSFSNNFYIGRANTAMLFERYAGATIDDVEVFNADRETLLFLDYIQRGKPKKSHYGFDEMTADRIIHPTTMIKTYGSPHLVPGKIGRALLLTGRLQTAEFEHDDDGCLGNLDLCQHGILLALWMRLDKLEEGMYYLSSGINGITISFVDKKLRIKATTSTREWELTKRWSDKRNWHYYEISWNPGFGLRLYLDNELISQQKNWKETKISKDHLLTNRFILGNLNDDKSGSVYGAATFDEMEYWFGPREYLLAFGYILREKPEGYVIHMDEVTNDGRTLVHPSLPITLHGNPVLVPGRVGNAVNLNGGMQYIDLGQNRDTCLGNLEKCQHGIMISFWVKFNEFNYNMFLLSTGVSGIKIYYLGGFIYLKIDSMGKSWRASLPKPELRKWHYLELSWQPEFGVSLYLDNQLRDHEEFVNVPETYRDVDDKFLIGAPNSEDTPGQRFNYAAMDVDEMEIWYGRREELLAFDYIVRDSVGYESFSMETATNEVVDHPRYYVTLERGAQLVPGKYGNAVLLQGRGQYVDLGNHMDKCIANIDLCNNGITISMWINANRLRDNTPFLSSPTYSLYYKDKELRSRFVSHGKVWNVATRRFDKNEWYKVMMSWEPEEGLSLYLDEEVVSRDMEPADAPQSDEPQAKNLYFGKSSDRSIRNTADARIDDIQYWYANIERLRAQGLFGGQLHEVIQLGQIDASGTLVLPTRTISLEGGAKRVRGEHGRAIKLDGKGQYINLGENLTCGGNLDSCKQGFTMRFSTKPERLVNNMYFLDSFPVTIFYRDGKLYATVRTSTQTWTVAAPGFKTGEWQIVDVSWHPEIGLTMFVNDEEVGAHKTHGTDQEVSMDWDRRTFFGRALTNMRDERYADTTIENFEVWNVRRDVLLANNQLTSPVPTIRPQPRPLPTLPPRVTTSTSAPNDARSTVEEVVVTQLPVVNSQQLRPRLPGSVSSETSKIIRFLGNSFIRYDFSVLTSEMLSPSNKESLSMQFITQDEEGLIWLFQGTRNDKIHLSVKDGKLLFVIDDGSSLPQQVVLTPPNSRVVNDFQWHPVKIEKEGRLLKFYIDDQYVTQITARSDVQFVAPGHVYLGGTPTVNTDTGGLVTSNIDGAITNVTSGKFTRPARELILAFLQFVPSGREGEFEIIDGNGGDGSWLTTKPPPVQVESRKFTRPERELIISFLQFVDAADKEGDIQVIDPKDWLTGNWTWVTQAPPTLAPQRPTPVTFTSASSMFYLRDALDLRRGGGFSFRFRTLEPRGILAIARGSAQSVNFMAIEMFDGILYFVYDFGTFSSRKMFSDKRMDDGEWHEVAVQVDGNQLLLSLDGRQFPTTLPASEVLKLFFYRLYIGGYDDMTNAPWPLYSRTGYRGCLESLKVNGIGVDLHSRFRDANIRNVEIGCRSSPRLCQTQPCVSGYCRDSMDGYVCECANTPFTGRDCNTEAVIGSWDGTRGTNFEFNNRQVTHTNDFSFRFLTPLRNTLLFKTEVSKTMGDDFVQAELVNGVAQVTMNVGGQKRIFTTGQNLNDYFWHTLYIRRRADNVEVWVDDETKAVGIIGGENYNLKLDRIRFGSLGESSGVNNYIGYLQNFIYDGRELLGELRRQNTNVIWIEDKRYDNLPLLTYKPVTVTTSDTHFRLPTMRVGRTMKILFKFKTLESNGVILYNTGIGKDVIAVELSNGLLRLAYNLGGRNMDTTVGTPYKLNDNKWHTVQISLNEGGQFTVKVDATAQDVTTSDGNGRLDLQSGTLYIGGLPEDMFRRTAVTNLIESRKGFRGCLASMDINGAVPDLMNFATERKYVLNGCTELDVACSQVGVCGAGVCMPGVDSHWCDCNMTGYEGVNACDELPIGYYFGNQTGQGIVLYEFPLRHQVDSDEDRLAFGFKTFEKDGVLYRLESSIGDEFIEIRLENGFIIAESKMSGDSSVILGERTRPFNDGQYHVVRFIRKGTDLTLQVDNIPPHRATGQGLLFDKVYRVILGGRVDKQGAIVGGKSSYYGILGGAYWNGYRWLDMLNKRTVLFGNRVERKGTVTLSKAYLLYKRAPATTPAPRELFFPPIDNIPPKVGGGGIVENIGGGPKPGVPPLIGGPGGELIGGPSLYVPGEPVPLAAALAGPAIPLGPGARAGAVVGTVLGTLAFLSSLMWALYKMKPGVPAVLSPGAGSAGGGMAISAPRAASNLAAVQAAGGAGGGGGAGAAKLTVVNGAAAGGGAGGAGAGGGSTTYTSFYSSTSSAVTGGGAGVGSGDNVDSATLRATGTVSNKGTALGTPKAARANLASSSSAYSYQSQSATMGGYGAGEGTDIIGGGGTLGSSSYDRHYMSSSSGGGLPDYDLPVGSGTLQSGYSTSTLNTHYNYQVLDCSYATGDGRVATIHNPKTYTTALTLILSDPSSRNIRHEPYTASVHASADHEYVDRAEDIIIEVPSQSRILKTTNATSDVAEDDYVTLITSDTFSSATYKSSKSNKSQYAAKSEKTTKASTLDRTGVKEGRKVKVESIFDPNRKASLQITPQTKPRSDGYERLESYTSETSINVNTFDLKKSRYDSRSSEFQSEDNLYESTATVTSIVRSDSVENTLASLEEESDRNVHGNLELLMQEMEDFNGSKTATVEGSEDKTASAGLTEVVYSSVNKSAKSDGGFFEQEMHTLPQVSKTDDRGKPFEYSGEEKTLSSTSFSLPSPKPANVRTEVSIDLQEYGTGVSKDSSTERSEVTEISETRTTAVRKPKRSLSKNYQASVSIGDDGKHASSKQIELSSQKHDIKIALESSPHTDSDISLFGTDFEKELNEQMTGMMLGMDMDPTKWFDLDQSTSTAIKQPPDSEEWEVQNLKTVTMNKQGQYVLTGGTMGAVTPGAAADEVRVDCCLMTNDGRNVVTGSSLGPPQVWDMANGELLRIMKGDTIGSTDLHLVCGDRLLVGAVHADMEINEYSGRKGVFNHTLQIWDFVTGKPLSMAEGEYCSALCPMSDSDKVLFGRTDKFGDATNIIAWDLMGNQAIKKMRYDAPVGNNDYINFLALSKNDRYVVAGFTNSFDNFAEFMVFDMTLTTYDISEPAMLKLDANPDCTAILPKDEAVTGLRNGDLVIWSIRTGQPSRQLLGSGGAHAHTREVKSVTLSDDGKYLVSASADGTLKVWDMHTERPIHTLTGHSDEVWCSSISPDNEIVVSGSNDGTIRLWRMKNGTEMCVFNCGVDIFFVTMSHDKGTIVALGDKYGARKLIMLQVVRTKIKKIVSS